MTDYRLALGQQVEQEVMACIGCHDCMLACPLPEAASVNIAELNDACQRPTIQNPRLLQFVTACTQCRQCVPACPADLSRADMVLFNKMKVEDSVPDHMLLLQVGPRTAASPYALDRLSLQLTELRLFAGVGPTELRRLVLKSTLRQLAPGELVCREGEFHDRLVVVLSGALEQSAAAAGGQRVKILVLGPGAFFGELAVMADQPEPLSVMATAPTIILEAPRAAVHRLMDQSPRFRETMDELYSRRALWTYARQPGILAALPEQATAELLAGAELDLLKAGDVVFRQGDPPADAFLVRSGFLRVTRRVGADEVALIYFREGDLFGVQPLLLGERAQLFTVVASSRSEVIRVRGQTVQAVVARHPQVRGALAAASIEAERVARAQSLGAQGGAQAARPAAPAGPQASAVLPLAWDVLVDQGVAQGHEVLVIDQNRCTSCQNCVEACGRRHGLSRLKLVGLQVENLLFPTACRHCEDPVCLLCSVSGIVRLPSGEITIVKDNCIGCGSCADRCPYGNISMHPVDSRRRGLLSSIWDLLTGGAAPKAFDSKVPHLAVKCDLCAGYDDYACVTACPVGAAFRVDPKEALGQDVLIGLEMRKRGA